MVYFLTWTTYGTWLPGDARGWLDRREKGVVQEGDPERLALARGAMARPVVVLDKSMREMAGEAMRVVAAERGWLIHALEVRSNHVHVVVAVDEVAMGEVMRVFKVRAARELNRAAGSTGKRWWTRGGDKRLINTQAVLERAVNYVLNQDTNWRDKY